MLGDQLLFIADDGESGRELWITDGTTEGTRLLSDIQVRPEAGAITFVSDRFGDEIYILRRQRNHRA